MVHKMWRASDFYPHAVLFLPHRRCRFIEYLMSCRDEMAHSMWPPTPLETEAGRPAGFCCVNRYATPRHVTRTHTFRVRIRIDRFFSRNMLKRPTIVAQFMCRADRLRDKTEDGSSVMWLEWLFDVPKIDFEESSSAEMIVIKLRVNDFLERNNRIPSFMNHTNLILWNLVSWGEVLWDINFSILLRDWIVLV